MHRFGKPSASVPCSEYMPFSHASDSDTPPLPTGSKPRRWWYGEVLSKPVE